MRRGLLLMPCSFSALTRTFLSSMLYGLWQRNNQYTVRLCMYARTHSQSALLLMCFPASAAGLFTCSLSIPNVISIPLASLMWSRSSGSLIKRRTRLILILILVQCEYSFVNILTGIYSTSLRLISIANTPVAYALYDPNSIDCCLLIADSECTRL